MSDAPPVNGHPPALARSLRGARGLVVCSTLELLALAVWVGGLVVIVAAVIPAVFNTFGMEPGGRFLTRVFDGYNRLTVGAIVVLAAAAAWRLRVDRAGLGRAEIALLALMAGVAAVIMLWLGPRSIGLQEQAFAAQGEAERKVAYEAFFRTHTVVRGLYLLNLGLGVAVLTVKARAWRMNSPF
ncbi:MAG: DUF4149 domain-containing protein [Nitrospirota bacterium]